MSAIPDSKAGVVPHQSYPSLRCLHQLSRRDPGSAIVYFDIEKKAEPVNPDPGTGGSGTDPAPTPDPGTGGGSGGGGGAPAPAPEPQQFAVTYHLDGGANAASNPATFAAGTAVALAAPTRDGYEFLGWYADAALTKRVTGIPADASGDVC